MSPSTTMTGGQAERRPTTKQDQEGDSDGDDDDRSRDLLLTQDEWSEGDDVEDEDDDAFFARNASNVPPTSVSPSKGALDGRIQHVALTPPNQNHPRRADTTAHESPPPSEITTTNTRTSGLHNGTPSPSSASNFQSPASRTLNTLSQQSQDDNLMYDMSQTDRDEASVLLQLKHGTFDTSSSSPSKCDNNDAAAKSPLRTPNNNKDKATSSRPSSNKNASNQAAKTRVGSDEQQERAEDEVRVAMAQKSTMAQNIDAAATTTTPPQNSNPSAAPPKQPACPKPKPNIINNPYRKQLKPKSAPQQQKQPSHPPQEREQQQLQQKASPMPTQPARKERQPQPPPKAQEQARQQKHVSWNEQELPQPRMQAPQQVSPPPPRPQPQQQRPASVGVSPPDNSTSDQMTDLADVDVLHIIVPVTGSLGATITQGTPPAWLMTCPTKKYCWVKAVSPASLAHSCGLRGNDWLLKDASAQGLASYAEIEASAKSNIRPLSLYVAREKQKTTMPQIIAAMASTTLEQDTVQIVDSEVETVINQYTAAREPAPADNTGTSTNTHKKPSPAATAAKSKTKASTKAKAARKAKHQVVKETRKPAKSSKAPAKPKPKDTDFLSSSDSEDEEDEHEAVKLPNDDKVVPFCKFCNTPGSKKKKKSSLSRHHPLCPENDFFWDSNADTILRQIVSGVERGCGVCAEAYETGKPPKKGSIITHAASCPNGQKLTPTTASKKKNVSKASSTTNSQKKRSSNTAAASSEKEVGGPPQKRQRKGTEQANKTAEKGASLQSKYNNWMQGGNDASSGSESRAKVQRTDAITTPKTSSEWNKAPFQTQRGTGATAERLSGGNSSSHPEKVAMRLPDGSDGPSVQETNGPVTNRQHKKDTQLPSSKSNRRAPTPAKDDNAGDFQPTTNVTPTATSEKPQAKRQNTTKSQQQPPKAPAPTRKSTITQASTAALENNRVAKAATVGPTGTQRVNLSPQQHGPTLVAAPANVTPTNAPKKQRHDRAVHLNQEEQDYDASKPCRSKWIHVASSPCGPLGFLLDDAVLITNARGIGHHETLLPSERYESNPFSDSASYHKTHQTPQEGIQLIRLQRDTMARRSWGFTVMRHEFGGACLVESVDPMSPAESAVCVGSGKASSLRVNDMIMAIDGKEVGGMTEEGVEIELETSGPRICLAVSRYRFAEQLTDTMAEVEESMVAAIDKAINDERNLGWVDIGTTDSSSPMISAVASKVLNNQLQSAPASNNHRVPVASPPAGAVEQTQSDLDTGTDEQGNSETLAREVCEKNAPLDSSNHGRSCQDQASDSGQDTTMPIPRTGEAEAGSVVLDGDTGGENDKETSHADPQKKKVRWQSDADDNDESDQTKEIRTTPLPTELAPTGNTTLDVNRDREHEKDHIDHANRRGDNTATSAASEQEAQTSERVFVEDEPAPEQDYPTGMDIDEDQRDESKDDGGCQDMGGSDDDEDDDDPNPALGCICGKVHGGNYSVFWLQCDSCDAWYNVAKKCVKFSKAEAENLDRWVCAACGESDDEDSNDSEGECTSRGPPAAHRVPLTSDSDSDESDQSASPVFERRKKRKRSSPPPKIDPTRELAVGTTVEVHPEGSHKFGGIGKVLKSYKEDESIFYTIRYTIHRYTEHDIPAEYVIDKSEEYA